MEAQRVTMEKECLYGGMAMRQPKVAVVGSINMDLITQVERPPNLGETVLGQKFSMTPGGKGANQGVAAAKLGVDVTMIGCLGDDVFGQRALSNLKEYDVNTDHVKMVEGISTGTASITLTGGDNSIVVVPGANNELTPESVLEKEEVIKANDVLLLQLEIPMESVITAGKAAQRHGVTVILNPAPMQELPRDLIEAVDYITPNEHEYTDIIQTYGAGNEAQDIRHKLIVTKGASGATVFNHDHGIHVPGFQVDEAVDTTGAGDAFNGALARCFARGIRLEEALHFANAAGALAVTKLGAQTGLPTEEEVNTFIKRGQAL